jgi:hypothetical protein
MDCGAASAWAMCAVIPWRAASAAVMTALAKAILSALAWLFTTIPARPTMQYLKPRISFQALDALAASRSDNEAAERLNEARARLFKSFSSHSKSAA